MPPTVAPSPTAEPAVAVPPPGAVPFRDLGPGCCRTFLAGQAGAGGLCCGQQVERHGRRSLGEDYRPEHRPLFVVLARPAGPEAERARREIDHGRRGVAGYVFGALQPATGEAFTLTYERRATVDRVDFLGAVVAWIDPAVERVYAVLDNLDVHSAPDVLLFALLHPRWEFVFRPEYAAYLNLIEPWLEAPATASLDGSAAGGRRVGVRRRPPLGVPPRGRGTGEAVPTTVAGPGAGPRVLDGLARSP